MRQKNRGVLDTACTGYDESLGEVELGTSTRHCEEQSDEAIQLPFFGATDCFASLAMTTNMESAVAVLTS